MSLHIKSPKVIITMSDNTIPQDKQQQDPALTPPEKSEFPPGTFNKYLVVDAIVNMRCPVDGSTMIVTQPIKLNETRQGTGYIMPQNCAQCEEANRNKGERVNQMLMITSVELKLMNGGMAFRETEEFIGG